MKTCVMEALFIVSPDWKKVLLLQKRPGSFLAGQWTGIGGKVDNGEHGDITKTVWRELQEESEISPNSLHSLEQRCMMVCRYANEVDYVMYAFTAVCEERKELSLASDDGTLQWHDVSQVGSLPLTDFGEVMLTKILDPKTEQFGGVYWKGNTDKVVSSTIC